MKTETIVLTVVAAAAVVGGYMYYQAHKQAAATPPPPQVPNGNPNQRSAPAPSNSVNDTIAAVNSGIDTLDKLGNAFGGW